MSSLSLPELIECRDPQIWAEHNGFLATPEDITAVLDAIRAQGFQRLRWAEGKKSPNLSVLLDTPFQDISSACPPRQGRRSNELLALTLVRGERAPFNIGVGFLRYANRWYFSTTGDNFEQVISSATVWRDIHVSHSRNER